MRILLDSCVWGKARAELEAAGHDAIWAGEWPNDPGDAEILAVARREGRVLVTLDKDFGELAVLHGEPHCGIIRLVKIPARRQGATCRSVIEKHARELQECAIITAELTRLRIRLPG